MASQLFDPFEVVREEVQESVGRAEALAASFADPDDPWRQQGPSHGLPPTAGTEPRSKLEALLRSLDSDLDNLRDALSSIEARRDRYATTDAELVARHEYLRATRERVDAMRAGRPSPANLSVPASPLVARRNTQYSLSLIHI